jgi:AcrR family transcriptional regulator
MRIRKDGEQTRRRVLEAALAVFGEKGFHDATHAEICQRARANIAAINYHFGSKRELYRATWQHAVSAVDRLYPFDDGIPGDAPPAERLRGVVHAIMQRVLDDRLGMFHAIRMTEHFKPTGILDDLIQNQMRIYRGHLRSILNDLLGPGTSENELNLCEMSIISQCQMVCATRSGKMPHPPWEFSNAGVAALTEHIFAFSLAGIEAVKRKGSGRAAL